MENYNQNNGYELGWDSEIEKDSPDFTLFPEGDYDFKVTKFERGRYDGGEKLPPCNMAVLTIELSDMDKNKTTLTHRLYLHSATEGLLCAFFTAIGARKHGERVAMNWNLVPGAAGRCKVGIRKYKAKDGSERTVNEIKRFYEPGAQAAQSGGGGAGYVPGRF